MNYSYCEESVRGYSINLHWNGSFHTHIEDGPGLLIQHMIEDPAIVIQYADWAKSNTPATITNRIILGEETIEFFVQSLLVLSIKPEGFYINQKGPVIIDTHGFLRIKDVPAAKLDSPTIFPIKGD
jgi:hypothetical protein